MVHFHHGIDTSYVWLCLSLSPLTWVNQLSWFFFPKTIYCLFLHFPNYLNFFATHCKYFRSGHPSLCAAISHTAAVLSVGTRCENSRSAVSKINTALAFAFTPKQRPCGAHSNLPMSHNTWFPVCKIWFHWLICSETANPSSCYKRLFQVWTTWRKGELSTVPRRWNWFSRRVQMTKLKSTIMRAATRVLKMKIFWTTFLKSTTIQTIWAMKTGKSTMKCGLTDTTDGSDADSSVLFVCFINCLNLCTVVFCAVILNVVISCFCFCLADIFCRHCFLCTKQHWTKSPLSVGVIVC